LPQNKTVFWRVRAKTSDVMGPWSAVWSFTTGNPPGVPVLLSPPNGALIRRTTLLFDWKDSTLPPETLFKEYAIQVDDDKDFSSPVVDTTTAPGDLGDSDLALDFALPANSKFYWRVKAVNTVNGMDHSSGWSAIWSFRTVLLAP
jgi:hypothetical protein